MLIQKLNKAWLGLVAVLLLIYISGWFIYDAHFKNELVSVSNESKKQLNLISILIKERLQKRSYELAKNLILNWGENTPDIMEIVLSTKNGFELAHYTSSETARHELVEEIKISYSYNNMAILYFRRSIDDVYVAQKYFLYQLIVVYLFISTVICFLVYVNLRTHKQKRELSLEIDRRSIAENSLQVMVEDLQESQARVRLLLDSTAEGIYGIDFDINCTFVNQACLDMLGYDKADDFLGKNIHELIHHSYSDGTPYPVDECRVCKAFRIGQGTHVDDEVLWRKDGSSFSTEYRSYPIFQGEKCIGAVVTFLDITIRKQQEQQIRRSQKMDALGQITSGIAHDTNNMLGVVIGYADALEEALHGYPKLVNFAKQILHAAQRSAKLTGKLLAFSRNKSTNPQVLNINALLHDEQNMLESILMSRMQLLFKLAEDLWPVYLDSNDIIDSVLNMSINAMHAIDAHGQLIIETSNTQLDMANAHILNIDPGDYVLLSISDTGSGMDEATRERIFEPFYSTKGDKGTGLGLSQVYGFVKRSGGTIKVFSELGHGSRFMLYFPRYLEGGVEEKLLAEVNVADLTGNETILLVDDERVLLDVTRALLESKGYHVYCAENGKHALKILENESIDLLFSDLIMPELDGFQLVSIVLEKYPGIKILLTSGFTEDQHLSAINEALQQSLLAKPYNEHVLLQRIRELLG